MPGTANPTTTVDISEWKPYLDRMGPKTGEYVENLITEGDLEFGRGLLGTHEILRHIIDLSQANDDLGLDYLDQMKKTPLGELSNIM